MSSAAYQRVVDELRYRTMANRQARHKLKLQPVDLATWDDGDWADPRFLETHPDDIDEPWPYRFENSQRVWICASDGDWIPGKVVGRPKKGMTEWGEGLFWWVEFWVEGCKVRKLFAPLNGDIKPDIEHTYQLMDKAGWLEAKSDSDQ